MVIVGIPTFGNKGLNEVMNTRFGRCNTFTFVTIENNDIVEVKSVANNAQGAMGGAGIQSAQIIGNNGATEVIVGNLGPNAMNSLNALNIKIYQSLGGNLSVKELIDLRLSGKLQVITSANVAAHAGMGGGMGGGRGSGRSAGMSGGLGGGGRRP